MTHPIQGWACMGKEGFEPPALWFVAICSSPLSYKPSCYAQGVQSSWALRIVLPLVKARELL